MAKGWFGGFQRDDVRNLGWWPAHVQRAFAALGDVLGDRSLHPDMLHEFPKDILPKHEVLIEHWPRRPFEKKRGHYFFHISGPLYSLLWHFRASDLEKLLRDASRKARSNKAI